MALKDRIREARQARKMTQIQLAKAASIKQPSLSELETGESKTLSGDTLIALSAALRVRPEWLQNGKGQMDIDASQPLHLAARKPDIHYRATPTASVDTELLQVVIQGVEEHFEALGEYPTPAEKAKWEALMYERFSAGAAPDAVSVKSTVERYLRLVK
jgi:transcriptional regulator with XRE-family HTH domain